MSWIRRFSKYLDIIPLRQVHFYIANVPTRDERQIKKNIFAVHVMDMESMSRVIINWLTNLLLLSLEQFINVPPTNINGRLPKF